MFLNQFNNSSRTMIPPANAANRITGPRFGGTIDCPLVGGMKDEPPKPLKGDVI